VIIKMPSKHVSKKRSKSSKILEDSSNMVDGNEELVNFPQDNIFWFDRKKFIEEVLKTKVNSQDWRVQFKAINDIRIINKFHPQLTE